LQISKFSGHIIFKIIREKSQTPIIILTALNTVTDRIFGFELGADDYIIKPFSPRELKVRLRYLLKKANKESLNSRKKAESIFSIRGLTIDFEKGEVLRKNLALKLTSMELTLLKLLIENSGKGLNRKTILDNIWGYTPERNVDTRAVDVYIYRLRSKIENNPKRPNLVLTIRGTGYMFKKY
jgi:OmpR family response regulator RpaB